MSNAKHTPGPWVAYDWGYSHWGVQADRRKGSQNIGRKIAAIDNRAGQDAGPEEEANARLIAASPDLLDAVLQLVATLDNVANEHPDELWLGSEYELAKRAILKATGNQ